MKILLLIFFLGLNPFLLITAAMADEFSAPNKDRRQNMSYEEYSQLREQMRTRMEKMHPEGHRQPETDMHSNGAGEQIKAEGAYGKGYHSRSQADGLAGNTVGSRPERPHFERPGRGEMGRR